MDKSVEHSREPRIRCLCMWQIHVWQGGQFNSMKTNGLFIKCVGKLIINLGDKSENRHPVWSLVQENTHTHTHTHTHNLLNVLETKSKTKSHWPQV